MSDAASVPAPRRWSWVSCPNPFYLLSAACVLHSSCWSMPQRSSGGPSLIIPGLIAGYTLILALVTLFVVRRWKVWDDARSMLVMLLLLCVDLALVADEWVVVAPSRGKVLLRLGFLFTVFITELVTRGVRLCLSWHWKLPHYLQMAAIFGWPMVLESAGPGDPLRRGLLHLYFIVTGMSFLPLVLAARRGREAVMMPPGWRWPIHPWSWCVVNTFCCLARGYSLTLSYDPVLKLSHEAALNQLSSILDWSFLTPYLLAWGVVVFECGHHSRNRIVRWTGLLFVLAGVLFSLPHPPINGAQLAHLMWLSSYGITPWIVALISGVLYCGWLTWRGSQIAPWGVLAGLVLLGLTGGISRLTWLPAESWAMTPIWLAFVWWALRPSTWLRSRHQFTLVALFTLGLYGEQLLAQPFYTAEGCALRILNLGLIAEAAIAIDRTAVRLQPVVILLGVIEAVILLMWQWIGDPLWTASLIDIWMAMLGSGLVAVRANRQLLTQSTYLTAGLGYTLHFTMGCQLIHRWYQWSGWPTFAAGVLFLHLAFAFSFRKRRDQPLEEHTTSAVST